jgi:hypothetical protein
MQVEPYRTHMVAWIDIMGFSAAIERSRNDKGQIHRIAKALESAQSLALRINRRQEGGWACPTKARLVSDAILVTVEYPNIFSLQDVTSIVAELTMAMLKDELFLRGAVVVGDHYESDNCWFGPAVLEAQGMEKRADWPRTGSP